VEERALTLRRDPFRIVVAPGGGADLVFEGTLDPVRYDTRGEANGGYVLEPIYTRHALLGPNRELAWSATDDEFLYLVSPISHWAGDPEVHVSVRHRAASDFTATSPTGFVTERSGSIVTERAVVRASSGANLRFRLSYMPPSLHHGGPVVGIGPRIGREELRVRLGYEVGISTYMILGAAADTNFDDYVTTASTLDFATPCFLFIVPSLSAGAGVPVQFRRDVAARVGVRGQLGLSWPLLSLLFPIDVYPAPSSSGSHVEASFLVQLSF
jgi:hypothetical protein